MTGGRPLPLEGRVKKEGERLKVPLAMPDDAGLQAARGEQKKPGKSGVDLCGRADADGGRHSRGHFAVLLLAARVLFIRIMPPRHPSYFLARSRPRLRTCGEKGYRFSPSIPSGR